MSSWMTDVTVTNEKQPQQKKRRGGEAANLASLAALVGAGERLPPMVRMRYSTHDCSTSMQYSPINRPTNIDTACASFSTHE